MLRLVTAFCALLALVAFSAAQQGGEVFRRTLQGLADHRYTGTRIVEFRLGADRYRNTEIVVVDGPRSRIEFAAGSSWEGQIVVEDRARRLHFFPDTNEIRVLPARRDEVVMRLRRLLQTAKEQDLKVRYDDGGTIAGRATRLLSVSDKSGNPIQNLWVDAQTAVPLKRELFDPLGTRIGYFEFQKIDYRPVIDPKEFEISRKGARMVTPQQRLRAASAAMGFEPWHLPPNSGYDLDVVRRLNVGNRQALMQVYMGDGARISLYQLQGPVEPARLFGRAGAGLNSHVWRAGDKTLVLVGDVPREQLVRLSHMVVR